MKKAYLTLITNALKRGLTISVYDGEEWAVKRSTKYNDIKEAIEAVEIAELRIRKPNGDVLGWVQVIPFGLEPDETLVDYTDSPEMCELLGERYEEI